MYLNYIYAVFQGKDRGCLLQSKVKHNVCYLIFEEQDILNHGFVNLLQKKIYLKAMLLKFNFVVSNTILDKKDPISLYTVPYDYILLLPNIYLSNIALLFPETFTMIILSTKMEKYTSNTQTHILSLNVNSTVYV